MSVWSSGVALAEGRVGSGVLGPGSLVGQLGRVLGGLLGRLLGRGLRRCRRRGLRRGLGGLPRRRRRAGAGDRDRGAALLGVLATPVLVPGRRRRAGRGRGEDAGGGGAGRHGQEVAVHVGLHDRQHQVDVVVGVVVAVDAGPLSLLGGQVVVARAEVDRGRQRRVVDVLGVAPAVVVAVHADDRPGRGDELHGPHGPVVRPVRVVLAGVGVGDALGVVLAVEGDAVDPGLRDAVVVEDVAAEAAVVGLDPADGGDQLPAEVAGLVGGVDDRLGALVGRQGGRGDAAAGGGVDDLGRPAAGHAGRHDARDRHARRGLDGLGRDRGPVGQGAGPLVTGDRRAEARTGHAGRPGGGEHGQRHECRGLVHAAER